MKYRQLKTGIAEEREKENMRAAIAEQAAIIDYIAIMTDIELNIKDSTEEIRMEVQ